LKLEVGPIHYPACINHSEEVSAQIRVLKLVVRLVKDLFQLTQPDGTPVSLNEYKFDLALPFPLALDDGEAYANSAGCSKCDLESWFNFTDSIDLLLFKSI